MSKRTDRIKQAKEFQCLRIWKYGVRFFSPKLNGGRKLISYTSLDGWISVDSEVIAALANDPAFGVKRKGE